MKRRVRSLQFSGLLEASFQVQECAVSGDENIGALLSSLSLAFLTVYGSPLTH